ncbi:MAG: T9SS type A sorting domain-containing protein [bacterium]|nr:T9SS type A sorting domain-containing protein [bacterium]
MKRTTIIFTALVILSTAASAMIIALDNNAEPEAAVRILKDTGEGTSVAITITGFERETVYTEGINYDRISLKNCPVTEETGLPELPVINFTIQIPGDASVEVSTNNISRETLTGYYIYPAQPPLIDGEPLPPFTIDNGFYGNSETWPTKTVSVSPPAVMRNIRLVNVSFKPFKYNPGSNELEVISDAVITLSYGDDATENTIFDTGFYDPAWIPMYKGLTLNSKSPQAHPDDTSYNTEYLFITSNDLRDEAQTIADFHNKMGLRSVVVTTDVTGTTRNDIKDYIVSVYEETSPPALEAVLIVGDTGSVVHGLWPGKSFASEWWYACLTGGGSPDLYADIFVGRFSSDDTADVVNQINKTKKYMSAPPSNGWLDKTILVAHGENAPYKYTECKESIRTGSYSSFTPAFTTHYGYLGATNADVSASINNGVGVVNYRGHGNENSWTGWNNANEYYTSSDFHALTNSDMTPVVLNVCCLSGDLTTPECFGEAQMNADDGAVGNIAASDPSYTTPNHDFDRQLYNALYDESIHDLGGILTFANHWLIDYYGSSSYAMDNVKMYMTFGDPSLKVWEQTPTSTLSASHPGTYEYSGTFSATVTSGGNPVSGAEVVLYEPSDPVSFPLYKGTTNGSGSVTLTLDDYGVKPGTMFVSAVKDGSIPYFGECTVQYAGNVAFYVVDADENVKGTVKATWSVNDTTGIIGYNLYRRRTSGLTTTALSTGEVEALSDKKTAAFDALNKDWAKVNDELITTKSSVTMFDNPASKECEYRLEIITGADSTFIGPVSVTGTTETLAIKAITLGQNYPNPSPGTASISFALPRANEVDMSVYDLKGRKVATLTTGMYQPGEYSVHTPELSSGIYLYRLTTDETSITKKMIVE